MIRMLANERLRHVKTRRANPFNSNSGALFKEVEYTDGNTCADARVREIHWLIMKDLLAIVAG
jgi:hypothetical protein